MNNIDLIGTFDNGNIKYSFHNINFSQKSLSTVTINQNFKFDNNIQLMVPSCKHNFCIYKTLKSSTEDNVIYNIYRYKSYVCYFSFHNLWNTYIKPSYKNHNKYNKIN